MSLNDSEMMMQPMTEYICFASLSSLSCRCCRLQIAELVLCSHTSQCVTFLVIITVGYQGVLGIRGARVVRVPCSL